MLAIVLALLQDPVYDTQVLEAGDRIDRVVSRDFDADDKPDLLVQNGRDLHLFLSKDGRFESKPSRTLRLDPSVMLWCLSPGTPPRLFTAGPRGLQELGFQSPSRDLVVHPSLFRHGSSIGGAPGFIPFSPDLDGDGRPELFLFTDEEILIFKESKDGTFSCLDKLPVPTETATTIPWAPHQSLIRTVTVPLLAIGDSDGDGRTDIGFYHDESLTFFRQLADGHFTTPESLEIAAEKKKRRAGRLLQFDIPPKIGDFNKDGILDLVIIYPSKGRVQVYYGKPGRQNYEQPDEVMRVADGWSSGVYLEDLNGDGKPDLVMGVIRKFGVTEGIQVFLSGKVDLELHVYPMESTGRFTKDPVQELKFSIPFSFHLTRDSASLDLVFRPNFRGDFNKDGQRDMLVRTDERTLKYYAGLKTGGMATEPTGSITTGAPEGTSTTEPFLADLNGDGVSDLVLKHVLINPARHVLELKLSR